MIVVVVCHERGGKATPEAQLSVFVFPLPERRGGVGGGRPGGGGGGGRALPAGAAGKLRAGPRKLAPSPGKKKKKKSGNGRGGGGVRQRPREDARPAGR